MILAAFLSNRKINRICNVPSIPSSGDPMSLNLPAGVQITGPIKPGYESILTHDALALVAKLHRAFEARRQELLKARVARQARIDAGEMPDFLPETKHIRAGDWKIAPVPAALQCRRVEITGPVEAKMIINAFNSGADSYMTDFEDSNSPNWDNQIQGQVNLYKAIRRELSFKNEAGKEYKLNDKIATLQIRPRGWHLDEKHVLVDGQRVCRRPLRLRPGLLPQRQGADRPRRRPVLLPAEDGKPPRSPPVERRFRHGPGPLRHAAGHHQGHRAGRNHPRHLRDGRNPLRTAQPLLPASTPGAGTTSSRASRSSRRTRTSAWPSAAPSPWKCPSCAATPWRWCRPATSAAPRRWAACRR
jgi:hypothetical protein